MKVTMAVTALPRTVPDPAGSGMMNSKITINVTSHHSHFGTLVSPVFAFESLPRSSKECTLSYSSARSVTGIFTPLRIPLHSPLSPFRPFSHLSGTQPCHLDPHESPQTRRTEDHTTTQNSRNDTPDPALALSDGVVSAPLRAIGCASWRTPALTRPEPDPRNRVESAWTLVEADAAGPRDGHHPARPTGGVSLDGTERVGWAQRSAPDGCAPNTCGAG